MLASLVGGKAKAGIKAPSGPPGYIEQCSGLRVKLPVVSSVVLKERLADYSVLKLTQVRKSAWLQPFGMSDMLTTYTVAWFSKPGA